MALSFPKLALPDGPETIAFRAVEKILTSDPTLKRVIRTWNSWNGDVTDALNPTFSTCPYLRISPRPGTSTKVTEDQHQMIMNIGIQIAVAGSNVDQLQNLWNVVRLALWPIDPVRSALVHAIGQASNLRRPVMTQCGYGTKLEEKGLRILLAEGTLEIKLLISTP